MAFKLVQFKIFNTLPSRIKSGPPSKRAFFNITKMIRRYFTSKPNGILEKSPDPSPVSLAKGEAHLSYFAKVEFQTCRNQLSPF